MTEAELEELIRDCPTLYHMAEKGSWPSIRSRGLLSTSALLDLYNIDGNERVTIEERRRARTVPLNSDQLGLAYVRDQIPMDDNGLRRCLPAHLTPADWYRLLNSRVFFWLTKDRLSRLLSAAAYRLKEHDVLEVNTNSMIASHRNCIWLCPINSGCTKPFPHARDETTFSRIPAYPYAMWRSKRRRGERAVELCVDYQVADIAYHTQRVVRMRGNEEVSILYSS